MTDASLDRELQTLLGVEPSPEFVARVRVRIADASPPAASWFGAWRIAASIVAVAAVATVAFVFTRDGGRNAPSTPSVLDSRTFALFSSQTPDLNGRGLSVSAEPASPVPRTHTAAQHESATSRAEPEILVDRRETAALRALIFGTREGRIDLAPVLAATTPSVMELPPVVDIEIPAITIDPIAPGTGGEGVRQ
ncbi:MAG TPA: hypothetical protein VKE96_18640 [Vicinamibacterales bacterium]|nr:hypothetical protein [Vicinamibacterales bacterium]